MASCREDIVDNTNPLYLTNKSTKVQFADDYFSELRQNHHKIPRLCICLLYSFLFYFLRKTMPEIPQLCAENTAMLVVDMQRSSRELFERDAWENLEREIQGVVQIARKAHMHIIHLFFSRQLSSTYGPFRHTPHSNLYPFFGDPSGDPVSSFEQYYFTEACQPAEGEWVLGKDFANGFVRGDFLRQISSSIRNVIVSGVLLRVCVGQTAEAAKDFGYEVLVPPALTGNPEGGYHTLPFLQKRGILTPSIDDLRGAIPITRNVSISGALSPSSPSEVPDTRGDAEY
jgi:nicotinamidase-related amidase